MKTLALVSLLAVAFASQSWTTFRADKHYSFRFEGQISTGLPVSSSEHSITRINSQVSLVVEDDRTARLQLKNIRVGSSNSEVSEPRDLLPFEHFEKIELTKEQQQQLSLPIRFRYEQGLISDIEFDREDKPWSENIKRAVLNMLQLNVQKRSRTDNEEMQKLRLESLVQEWNEEDSFAAREQTLEGDCNTLYTVVPSDDKKRVAVTKSIDFQTCEKRVDIRYNYRFGQPLPQPQEEQQQEATESATVINYNVQLQQNQIIIREVQLRSQYVFAPLQKNQQQMATYVNNKLTLIEENSEVDNVQKMGSKQQKQSLVYSTEQEEQFELFRMTGEEKYLKRVAYPFMDKKVEIARHILKEMQEQMQREQTQPEITHEIARFVELLRVFTKEDINEIAHECERNEHLKSLFYDQLAVAGTKNTLEYLFEKISERKVDAVRAQRIVKSVAFTRNPHQKIVDMLIELLENVEKDQPLRQSVSLTLGAVLNGLCGEQKDQLAVNLQEQHTLCPREVKEKYVKELKNRFDNARTQYEKVLALKTIANSGMDLIVFPLEEIIKNEQEEKIVRLQAIDALRKLRNVMPRKVQSVLLPVYKNVREAPEIRAAAFHQIMQTLPERMVIDQITQQLNKEPSRQVYSFVYTALKNLAQSELPMEQELSRDIEMSLKLHRVQPRKTLDSTLLRESYYSEQINSGSAISAAILFSNDSIFPKELMASLDTVFAGEWTKYFAQIGFSQQNIDKLLFELVEKLEKKVPALRANRDSVKPSEALRELMKKMGIEKRRRDFDSNSHAIVYLRYKDMDFAVLPINEKIVNEIVEQTVSDGKIRMDFIRRTLERGIEFNTNMAAFVYERTRIVPTTLGMPLEITSKLPTYVKLQGVVKADIQSSQVIVSVKGKPEIVSTHVSHMEVRSPIISNGVRITLTAQLSLPVDAVLDVEFEKKMNAKLTVRAPESQEQKRVFLFHSRPVTYVRFENNQHKWHSAQQKTVLLPQQPRKEVNFVYGEEVLGLKVSVNGNIHRHLWEKMQNQANLPAIIAENHIEVVMEKSEQSLKEYIAKVIVHPIDWDEQNGEQPEMKSFYGKDDEYFNVEDSEYLSENEQDRRDSFSRYVKDYKKGSSLSHRVIVEVSTVGGEKRRASAELTTKCTNKFSFCKWHLEAQRTPVYGERKDWTLTAKLQTLFPEQVESLQQLHEQKHRELNGEFEARWGSEQKNSISAKIQAEQSKEQQKWQKLTSEKSQKRNSLESLELLELASRLNQIKVSAEYDIQPETQMRIATLSYLLKAYRPFSTSIQYRRLEQAYERNGRLTAKLTVEPQTWRYVNISMETPSERMEIENIRLPFRPTFLTINKASLSTSPIQWTESPTCEVGSSRVSTFDDVIYRAPITTCYSVLAKDCSENPRFVVLMKKTEKKGEEKKIKIITEENEIEIQPKENDFEVKVNGKHIQEDKYERYQMESQGEVIVFENKHIIVRFDGVKAEIQMNKMFKNQQCGICGHYDEEHQDEFRRADNQYTEDLEEFHRSYLLKDSECEVEEERLSQKDNYKRYNRFDNSEYESEESSEEQNWNQNWEQDNEESYNNNNYKYNKYDDEDDQQTVEPVKRNRVIEYSNRVCFSQERIPECPRNTNEEQKTTKDQKVKFACLDRSKYEARRLLRDVRSQDISEDVKDLPVSFVETVQVPKTCVVY